MSLINTQRLVDHFLQLIQIDSESGNEKKLLKRLRSNWANLVSPYINSLFRRRCQTALTCTPA